MRRRRGFGLDTASRSQHSGIRLLFQFFQRDLDVVHVLRALIDLLPQTTGDQPLHFSGKAIH